MPITARIYWRLSRKHGYLQHLSSLFQTSPASTPSSFNHNLDQHLSRKGSSSSGWSYAWESTVQTYAAPGKGWLNCLSIKPSSFTRWTVMTSAYPTTDLWARRPWPWRPRTWALTWCLRGWHTGSETGGTLSSSSGGVERDHTRPWMKGCYFWAIVNAYMWQTNGQYVAVEVDSASARKRKSSEELLSKKKDNLSWKF